MKFALFLTQGTSLKLWDEKGWLYGGAPIKSYNHWADAFETVYFVSYGGKEDLAYGDVLRKNIIILPKKWKIPSLLYSLLSPWIYRHELRNVDLMYSAQMQGAWSAALAKKFFKKKFVLHCGYMWSMGEVGSFDSIKKIILPFIERFVCRTADFIILTSEHARAYIIKRYRIDPRKITVTRNPVDTTLFRPLGLKKKPRSLIYVGRLEKEKNPLAVLKAMVGLDMAMTLTIAGRGSLEKELRHYAAQNGLKVEFRGNIPNNQLPQTLNQHELFIMPSFYEGSPKALLEAMACGMAVIATNVRGINEIIHHKENGYLCELSPDSIRKAILTVFEDNDLRNRMGEKACEYILKNCDLEKKIEKELNIFKKIIQSQRH